MLTCEPLSLRLSPQFEDNNTYAVIVKIAELMHCAEL